MQTVKDTRFPKRSEMREFGKVYNMTERILSSWKKYIEQIKSHLNNFQHTYQVCFTCNLGKIITSDEELRQAIKRKELLIREEKEEVESRE